VLNPGVVGVAHGRFAVSPALVAAQQLARPVADVEGRVSQNEVGLEVGVQVAEERVSRLFAEPGLDAVDGQIHVGEAPQPQGLAGRCADGREPGGAALPKFSFRSSRPARITAAGDTYPEPSEPSYISWHLRMHRLPSVA